MRRIAKVELEALGPRQRFRKILREDAAIGETGQRIMARQRLCLQLRLSGGTMRLFQRESIGTEDLESLCQLADLVGTAAFGHDNIAVPGCQFRERLRHRAERPGDVVADQDEDTADDE